MHIGYFAPNWPPERTTNGITTYVGYMREGLQALGHRVTIFSPEPNADAVGVNQEMASVPSSALAKIMGRVDHIVGSNLLFTRLLAAAILKAHEACPFDIIEIEETFGRAYYLTRALPIPVITRTHGPHFLVNRGYPGQKRGITRWLQIYSEGRALAASSGVTCPSPEVLRLLCTQYRLDRARMRVIPNPMPVEDERSRWSLDASNPNTIAFIGRFDMPKGADIVIEAFSELALKLPSITLMFAGPDNGIIDKSGVLRKFDDYIAMKVPERVRPRIQYLGAVSRSMAIEMRRRARVVVIASRYETAPYALSETLSIGAPVVTTENCGAIDHIKSGVNGVTVPSEDPSALASAIAQVLANPEFAARIAEAGWLTCKERFSVAAISRSTAEFYHSVSSST